MRMAAVGSARPKATLLSWAKAVCPHQPVDAVLAAALPEVAQIAADPRRTIGLATGVEAPGNQRHELGVLLATSSQRLSPVSGKASQAHAQGVGQRLGGKAILESVPYREAAGGISADKMPKAFLKCHAGG
jgi:hypothetical protein